jgi:PTH2 family peptidyl-tRNA hydrolase
MKETKQVIILRKGICGSRGKEISQGCHASMGALLSLFCVTRYSSDSYSDRLLRTFSFCPIGQWLDGSFTKITLYVKTEEELIELEKKAKDAGLPHALITDNGRTVFHGVPTKTALAIGPWWSEDIDLITGHLPLY